MQWLCLSWWGEIRDVALKNLEVGEVTEEVKQKFSGWLMETLLPVAETAADKFIDQTIAQAREESGWCKIRDLIVLPAAIRGGLWLVKATLSTTVAKTAKS